MSRTLPVLVDCDRLHARLTQAAYVARFGAASGAETIYSGEHGRTYTGCRRCPQGAARAGQRLSDETPEEYQARLIESLGETGPEGALSHVEVHRFDSERSTHRWALWHTVREIEGARTAVQDAGGDVRAVPQNGDACTRYGSPCPYLPVCEGTASITDDTRYRRLPVIHAELSADMQHDTLKTRKAA